MRLLSSLSVLVLGGFVTLVCAAQAPTSAGPTPPETVIHTTSNLVLVDVVVTDKGEAVRGLDQARFHIFEDGKEQRVASFDDHRPLAPSAVMAPPPPLPPNVFNNVPLQPPTSAVNVLLLDSLNTPKADQIYVHRQVAAYIAGLPPGTALAIFALGSRLELVQGFTSDAALLAKALESPKAAPQDSGTIAMGKTAAGMRDQAEDTVNMRATNARQVAVFEAEAQEMRGSAAEITAQSADIRVPATLGAMQQLARYLSGIPGRKNVVWFSGSFPIDLMPNTLDPQESLDTAIMRNYSREIRETGRLLSAARIAVYSIYAGTPRAANSLHASHDLVVSDRNKVLGASRSARNDTKAETQIQSDQASMIKVSDLTGGQFFNTTEIKEALASAIDNGSSYYTVSYVPGGKLDGKFRKFKVQIDNATYDLSYRLGFYADSPDKPSPHSPGETSPIMVASMIGAPTATEIQFQARVLPATDAALQGTKLPEGPAGAMAGSLKGPVQRYVVDLKVDPHGFAFAETSEGARQAAIEFVLVGYDAKGKRVNYLDSAGKISLNSAQFGQLMKQGLSQRLALDLPAGPIALRIVVYDLAVGRAGSLEVPLTISAN